MWTEEVAVMEAHVTRASRARTEQAMAGYPEMTFEVSDVGEPGTGDIRGNRKECECTFTVWSIEGRRRPVLGALASVHHSFSAYSLALGVEREQGPCSKQLGIGPQAGKLLEGPQWAEGMWSRCLVVQNERNAARGASGRRVCRSADPESKTDLG